MWNSSGVMASQSVEVKSQWSCQKQVSACELQMSVWQPPREAMWVEITRCSSWTSEDTSENLAAEAETCQKREPQQSIH